MTTGLYHQKMILHSMSMPALDGYPLRARLYEPEGEVRAQVLVAGATGVPQGFYRRFAQYAAERGFATMTFDYRGIGESAPASLRGFELDYLDWSRLDLAAAVEAHSHAQRPLFLVGHSFGGHAFGVLPNYDRVAAFYTFATGAGWAGWMPPLERLRVGLMWNVLGPMMTAWKGYLNWSLLGMGEDLPLNVYRQWRAWCRYPRYFFDDPQVGEEMARLFERVETPMVAANASDDTWAPPASRDAFMQGYRRAPWLGVDIHPEDGRIGHMGYFRAGAEPLWDEVLTWFESQRPPDRIRLHRAPRSLSPIARS